MSTLPTLGPVPQPTAAKETTDASSASRPRPLRVCRTPTTILRPPSPSASLATDVIGCNNSTHCTISQLEGQPGVRVDQRPLGGGDAVLDDGGAVGDSPQRAALGEFGEQRCLGGGEAEQLAGLGDLVGSLA